MATTIKVTEETKKRLLELDLAGKGKTFDMMINDLVTNYEKKNKDWNKDYSAWKKNNKTWVEGQKKWQKVFDQSKKEKKRWDSLMKWAEKNGFEG